MNKNTLQRVAVSVALFAVLFLGSTYDAWAATTGLGDTILGEINSIGSTAGFTPLDPKLGLPYRIGMLIRGIMGLLGVIFLVLVVYAGYKWMLAHGEPGEVKEAQKLLLHSIIGLVITVSAYALSTFVINAIRAAAL